MDGSKELRSAFAELVEDAPCGIVVTDPDGRLQFMNETLKRWLKIPAGNAEGAERLPDLMAGAGKLFYETHLAPMMRLQGFAREISCTLKVTGAAPLPVMLSGVARRDAAGDLVRFDYTIFDARERRIYEDELRSARRKAEELAAIVRTSPDAILRVAEAGLIRSWNDRATTLLGARAGAIADTPVQELIRFRNQPDWFSQAAERCKTAAEAVFESVDDDDRHFEVTVVPISEPTPGTPKEYSIVLRDITTRKRAEQRLRLAMGEMKHRIKNTLAVVSAIARQTLPAEIRTVFIGRLHALSRAHDVLTDGDQKKADVRYLLELTAAEAGGGERFRITGHSVMLPPEKAQSLSMALHELATNALKYGALSHPGGHVQVDCELRDRITLRLVWQERDGPPVVAPTHRGFGSKMINNLLKADLLAEVDMDYRPDGLRCEIVFDVSGG